jgi:hypothetical protein
MMGSQGQLPPWVGPAARVEGREGSYRVFLARSAAFTSSALGRIPYTRSSPVSYLVAEAERLDASA